MKKFQITFLPSFKTVFANEGDTLLDLTLRENIPLEHVCGGSCSCSTCHIIIKEGFELLDDTSEEEQNQLAELGKRKSKTSRLACQTEILTNLVVEIP